MRSIGHLRAFGVCAAPGLASPPGRQGSADPGAGHLWLTRAG
jgi:hypothetical protein